MTDRASLAFSIRIDASVKMHLTPKFVFLYNEFTLLFEAIGWKKI